MAVIITPEKGRHKAIGQLLLGLAEHPSQVQWVTWPVAGYAVPEELFAQFHEATAELEEAYREPAQEAPKKRRGRQKKESTDNTNSEEE